MKTRNIEKGRLAMWRLPLIIRIISNARQNITSINGMSKYKFKPGSPYSNFPSWK
jgi:hypothetical protein